MDEDRIEKRIRMAVGLARKEAKLHNTYVVYMDENREIVKEYPNGKIIKN
ncbi:hypothetical protein [Halobacillus trueperi]|nr:hypothetical protein [Halobacillus trueperi]